jgi:hypothetical protein
LAGVYHRQIQILSELASSRSKKASGTIVYRYTQYRAWMHDLKKHPIRNLYTECVKSIRYFSPVKSDEKVREASSETWGGGGVCCFAH